jgi:Ca2+-binding RTX toxin-like protein
MTTETIDAGQGTVISVGNGNNTVNVIGGSQDSITIGNGNNALTVSGGSGDTITAGSGNDSVTVTGGADNTITVGNGNVTVVASGDNNDAITLGKGNDTVYLGADDTLNMGKGSELVVLPSSTPTLAVTSITVTEDQTISLAGLGISAGVSALGFGQENISGFAAADQLEFTTAQFANFSAVMADATQVGANTVITDASSDTITLENVAKSSLAAKNFVFVNAGSSSGSVLVTMTGLPSGLSNFNGGTYTASSGTWTGTAAQFDALTFKVGEETSAQLTVTATDTTTGYSISKS